MDENEWIKQRIRANSPVSKEEIAKHLGLEQLWVGARRSGSANDSRGPQVLAWWAAHVKPSFAPKWVLGALHEEEWTRGPNPDRVTIRGFLADKHRATVATLEVDPIPEAMGRLNPFAVVPTHRCCREVIDGDTGEVEKEWSEYLVADGLSYSVSWETKAVGKGGFEFSNPQAGWPLEFERLLYEFALKVMGVGGAGEFEEHIAEWLDHRPEILGTDAAD
jgi:hypothetical protein